MDIRLELDWNQKLISLSSVILHHLWGIYVCVLISTFPVPSHCIQGLFRTSLCPQTWSCCLSHFQHLAVWEELSQIHSII